MTTVRAPRLTSETLGADAEVRGAFDRTFEVLNPALADIGSAINGGLGWENLRAVVKQVTFTAPSRWTAFTYSAPWADVNTATYPAGGYWKDRDGIVHLRGVIDSGTMGTTAATLPTGYRPAGTRLFATVENDRPSQVVISSAGVITPTTLSVIDTTAGSTAQSSGAAVKFSLDGIHFEASDPRPALPGAPFPILIQTGSFMPRSLVVLKCEDITTTTTVSALPAPQVAWEAGDADGRPLAKLTRLEGLTPDRKYRLTVLLTA